MKFNPTTLSRLSQHPHPPHTSPHSNDAHLLTGPVVLCQLHFAVLTEGAVLVHVRVKQPLQQRLLETIFACHGRVDWRVELEVRVVFNGLKEVTAVLKGLKEEWCSKG